MRLSRWHRALALLGGVAAAAYYLFLAGLPGGLFSPSFLDAVFNAMALNLLEGRFDIDPAIIEDEAFDRNGRSYAYFGILPALLRLPLAWFGDLGGLHLGRLYTALALLLGSLAQAFAVHAAFRQTPAGPAKEMVVAPMILASVLSGPGIQLIVSATVYDEAAAWAWALACLFVAFAFMRAAQPGGRGYRTLLAMGIVAGIALSARPTTGIALTFTFGLILLRDLSWSWSGKSWRAIISPAFSTRIVVPVLAFVACAAVALVVNAMRWGNPLEFGDLRINRQIATTPERVAVFETYGLIHPPRIGYALLYYFLPIWTLRSGDDYLFGEAIRRMFDGFELPATSFLLTDPFTMALAGYGVIAATSKRVPLPQGSVWPLLLGLSVVPALLLCGWYMAFRYRLDFFPLFLFLSCLGGLRLAEIARSWPAPLLARSRRILAVMAVLQILSAHGHAILYVTSPMGAFHRAAPGAVAQPADRAPAPREDPRGN